MTPTQDELAVRTLVDGLVAGWNAQDGTAFARQFAADADFTNVMGLHAKGRDVIARGHDEIFATLFKGTTLTATVEQIRFLRPDVAVASVVLALRQKDGTPWGAFPRPREPHRRPRRRVLVDRRVPQHGSLPAAGRRPGRTLARRSAQERLLASATVSGVLADERTRAGERLTA